jgi:hypothetical protein
MGAAIFFTRAKGKTARAAFDAAVSAAEYDHGHSGYTGTIAEKDQFVMIPLPQGQDAKAFADLLIENRDGRIDDKWGPAGCIQLAPDEFLFFGWASD